MGKDENNDPLNLSGLKVAAIQMHEIYVSFLEAGFTEDQAIELTVRVTLRSMDT